MTQPWLSIVGIGEDGLEGLSPAARKAISDAVFLVGGARHLALAGPVKAQTLVWPSPLQEAFPAIEEKRGQPVTILATGDPFFHGVGSLIAAKIDPAEIMVFPAPSAYTLAAARLGWAGQDCLRISLHGRALERVIPCLHPGRKILALSWDATTPGKLAELLTAKGFGRSRLCVLEALGGPREAIRSAQADQFDMETVDPLNIIGLEVEIMPGARPVPFTPGLPDDWFEHDGQITKRDIRAITLSSLQPLYGQLLWDIGAGSGSIGIEWMLSDPSCRAIAFEARGDRAARIGRNAINFGVPDLKIVEGEAPIVLAGHPAPDAIFIGGGANADVIDQAIRMLKPNGRLVVNAVTLETQALLIGTHKTHGGDLLQLSIARVDSVGSFHALKPAMSVLQWVWIKAWVKAATEPQLAVGIGCKSGVSAEAVSALIKTALRGAKGKAVAIYTIEEKQAEAGLAEAAKSLGLPIIYLTRAALKKTARHCVTVSQRVLALFGVPSIAEAAALAGAGPGAELMLPRISAKGVTCAVAKMKETS